MARYARRGRRRGLSMMFMLLMGGGSLLLPMLMGGGGGGNPLAAITEKLGGLFGGGKKKEAGATTQSTARSGSAGAMLLPELPRIRTRETTASPASSPLPAHPRQLSSPDLTGSTTSGDGLSPSAPSASGTDVASADAARDQAYSSLQAALESGDMTRIRAADQAYRAADQSWKQARRRSMGL